jgi:hypothetical protein
MRFAAGGPLWRRSVVVDWGRVMWMSSHEIEAGSGRDKEGILVAGNSWSGLIRTAQRTTVGASVGVVASGRG